MSFEEWYDQHFGSADPNVVKAGNIDLGDRPAVYNEDGTVSTEKSFSIQDDQYGREVLLPQVVGGKMLSKKDAIKHYRDTGEHLGIYKDIPTANAYADAIHNRTPRLDTPETFPAGNLFQSVRDLPGWAAYRMYRGATRTDLPGEGPSAREQEAAGVIPPPYQRGSFSVDNARSNLRDIKNAILPPGFSVQRGLDSALAPAKWLFNEVRQGVLPDEAIEEIKRNPYSPRSIEYMTQAAISLSGGKGGREVPMGPRPVPRRVWDMWNPTDHPGVKVDEMGNHYEATGTHYDKTTGESHIIVKPKVSFKTPGFEQMDLGSTTWEQLGPSQKQWFLDQWKLGNTPGMKDVPPEPAATDQGSGEVWHDNPFQKFLKEQYPEGTSGQFKDPETLPPGELSKGTPPPLNEPTLKVAWEWWDGLQKGDITREQYDAAMDAIRKGEMPPLPSQPSKPFEPMPEAGSSLWDEWAKKHGGQKPDFGTKPDLGPKPGEPGSDEHYTKWLTDRNLPDNDASNEAYWQSVGESDKANMEKFLQDNTVDFEVQPDMTLEQIYDDLKANPEKSDFWSNLPGPKYIEGRGMAMPYSDEGKPYLPPPPEEGLTPYNPRNPPNLPPPPGISDDLWLQEHFGTGGATDRTPPNVDPLDSMLSDWAKYMDEKGIDYGQNEPPPVDPQVQKDFDHIEEWWRKMQQNKNRFNWKPPEHGGNNL